MLMATMVAYPVHEALRAFNSLFEMHGGGVPRLATR